MFHIDYYQVWKFERLIVFVGVISPALALRAAVWFACFLKFHCNCEVYSVGTAHPTVWVPDQVRDDKGWRVL